MTIDEAHDSIRYDFATGWGHLLAAADRISLLAHEGKLTAHERDQLHDHLAEAFDALSGLLHGLDDLDMQDDWALYSDGSRVFSAVLPAEQFPRGGPLEGDLQYCGDISPNVFFEPGAEIVVEKPPHLRNDMADGR